VNHIVINNNELCHDVDPRDSQLRRFWSLQAMGKTYTDTTPHSMKYTAMLSNFSDPFYIEEGRAFVSLPKKELVTPADSHTNAQRRFQSLTKVSPPLLTSEQCTKPKYWTTYFNIKSKLLRPDLLHHQNST